MTRDELRLIQSVRWALDARIVSTDAGATTAKRSGLALASNARHAPLATPSTAADELRLVLAVAGGHQPAAPRQ